MILYHHSITRCKHFLLKKRLMGYFAVYSLLQFSQCTTVTLCHLMGATTEHMVHDNRAHGAFQKSYKNILLQWTKTLGRKRRAGRLLMSRSSARVKLDCTRISPQQSDNVCDSNLRNINLSCCRSFSRTRN